VHGQLDTAADRSLAEHHVRQSIPGSDRHAGICRQLARESDGLLGYCSRLPGFGQLSAGVPLD